MSFKEEKREKIKRYLLDKVDMNQRDLAKRTADPPENFPEYADSIIHDKNSRIQVILDNPDCHKLSLGMFNCVVHHFRKGVLPDSLHISCLRAS